MSDCIHRERLSDYLDGGLAPEQRDTVRRHLDGPTPCGCGEEMEALRSLAGSLAQLPPGPVPPGGWERLEAELDAIGPEAEVHRASWSVLPWAAAAVMVAAILAWSLVPSEVEAPGPAATSAPRAEAVSPGPASPQQVVLAVSREEFPPVRFTDDQLLDHGTELASLDALIELARSLPAENGEGGLQQDIGRLASLRQDLLTEMILQAQAERTDTW